MTVEPGLVHLLDANVLVALTSPDHVHHERARQWFATAGSFATCPLTQLALVRLLMRFGSPAGTAAQALTVVAHHARHVFWPASLSVQTAMVAGLIGHRQVTDAYLVALAAHYDGRVVTFDQGLAATHRGRVTAL